PSTIAPSACSRRRQTSASRSRRRQTGPPSGSRRPVPDPTRWCSTSTAAATRSARRARTAHSPPRPRPPPPPPPCAATIDRLLGRRLAPEHPLPAVLDDAVAAYECPLARGLAPGRIILGGDSAGGGLTVATLLALRDRGMPRPGGGVCISPWVDLTCSGASYA